MQQGTRTGGWSVAGKLKVGGSAFGGAPAVNLQVDFKGRRTDEKGRLTDDPRQRPAGVYTVEIGIDIGDRDTAALGPLTPFLHVNPIAVVEFSTEGNTVRREISVVNGTSISGTCDHVNIRVFDATTASGGGPVPPGTDLDYTVTILVSPGTRPARFSPPYLNGNYPAAILAGGTFVDVPVPVAAGAHTVAVFARGGVGAIPGVYQQASGGDVLATYFPDQPIFVPLIPGTAIVRLANDGPALSSAVMSAVFGIDG